MTLQASAILFHIQIWIHLFLLGRQIKIQPLEHKTQSTLVSECSSVAATYTVFRNSQLFTVPLADKLVRKWCLSNYSTPEGYLYGSRCWIHGFGVFGMGVSVASIRINGPLVSCSLLKVLYLVLCASSSRTLSFLMIFPFGKENSTYLERATAHVLFIARHHSVSPAVWLRISEIT